MHRTCHSRNGLEFHQCYRMVEVGGGGGGGAGRPPREELSSAELCTALPPPPPGRRWAAGKGYESSRPTVISVVRRVP